MKTLFNIKNISAGLMLLAFAGLESAQAQQAPLQYFRPYDQRGLNIFETGKTDTVAYDGFKLRFGANFTQQFQALDHSTKALERRLPDPTPQNPDNSYNANELIEIGPGFNLAAANLNIDAQLADGIRVSLITYLSSRHHPEAWVKGGYLQVDKLPMLKSALIDRVMENVTIRAGHFEINYGDAHFRRTDNGNALYNPLVGNYIMDAFTTEIGGEVYYQNKGGLIAMVGVTGGEIQGGVTRPNDKAPTFLGKLGYDKQLNDDLRVRLTGSVYRTEKSISNTLYGGDRAGSRYYLVMENIKATTAAQFTSGHINPGFRSEVTAFMVNPFVKFNNLELFGTYEVANGRAANEADTRNWNQWAVDLVYRLPMYDQVYVAGRYNTAGGQLAPVMVAGAPVAGPEITINRVQAGMGWFITKNVLLKGEWVKQKYSGFAPTDIRNGGEFNGVVVEGVIGF